MRVNHAFPFAVLLFALLVSPTLGSAQLAPTNEAIPAWQTWKTFYDSLDFYAKRSPQQDTKIVTDQLRLTPGLAATVIGRGRSFVSDIQRIDEEARAIAAQRYKYIPSSPAKNGVNGPKHTPIAKQKSVRERSIEDGLYAEVEAKKQAALANHLRTLAQDVGATKLEQMKSYLETSIAPHITRFSQPAIDTSNPGLPPGLTRETPAKVR